MLSEQLEELRGIKLLRTEFLCVKWNAEDTILAVSCSNGLIRTYSSPSFELMKALSHRTATLMPITGLSWFPDDSDEGMKDVLLAVSSDGWVMMWQTTMGILLQAVQLPGKASIVCEFCPNGSMFAVSCKDFSVSIFNSHRFEEDFKLNCAEGNILGHSNKIFAMKWADNSTLVTGGWDNVIIVWDVFSHTPLNSFYGPHLCGQAIDIKNLVMLVGAYGRHEQVQLFNLENSENIACNTITDQEHPGIIYACQFSKADQREFYATVGSELCVFSTANNQRLFQESLAEPSYCCDWANSENVIAIGNSEGEIRVFYVKNAI